jgi:hypothetical protein
LDIIYYHEESRIHRLNTYDLDLVASCNHDRSFSTSVINTHINSTGNLHKDI